MTMSQPESRPPSAAPNGGRITDQVQTTENDPAGRATRGVRVSFQTGKGQTGSVFVPEGRYTYDNVVAAVREAANRIDGIHGAEF